MLETIFYLELAKVTGMSWPYSNLASMRSGWFETNYIKYRTVPMIGPMMNGFLLMS
jgi:hypothetical protein